MATHSELGRQNKFVRSFLPWLIAAGALLFYAATINPWVSISNLNYVATATGQTWMPELTGPYGRFGPFGPLFFALTYPIRYLPEKWVPLALNLFSAVCAAGTLGLLARSVSLLPHDRTFQQRQREHSAFNLLSIPTAWIPPVVAAFVCGLQLSYWENATVVSEAALHVLLLAYVIRCLLEYRIDPRNGWFYKAAFVYGAAMTGNWVMIGLLPLLLTAMIWIRGVSFFSLNFLRWLVLCGVAGLLFYLLLPLVNFVWGNAGVSFLQAFLQNAAAELSVLKMYVVRVPRYIQLLLATTSVLPLLLISVRWASHFGDPSKLGIAVATAFLHAAHLALLGACIWVSFDPVFSPRISGLFIPELHYLLALSVGYFIGYFLLVFRPMYNRQGRAPGWQVLFHRVSLAVMWSLVVLIPVGLLWKNLPSIRFSNGPAVEQFAQLLTQPLPPRAMLLADSETSRTDMPVKLWLVRAWLARQGRTKDYVLADTMAMQVPFYHEFQQKRYGREWPPLVQTKKSARVPDGLLLKLVSTVSDQKPVYYLNPTFGYYIESVYQHPRGMAMELRRYPTNSLDRPAVTMAEVKENEMFWKTNQSAYEGLLPWTQENGYRLRAGRLQQLWMRKLHIPFEQNRTAMILGKFYSQHLNSWGVQLQQSGQLREAGRYFDLAQKLNPNNVAARANLECNRQLRAGQPVQMPPLKSMAEEMQKYRDWSQVMRDYGPFDDPQHCMIQAVSFANGRLYRQAGQQFERIHEFDPDFLPASVWLARFYARYVPDKALTLVAEVRNRANEFSKYGIRSQDVSVTEAMALFAARRTEDAEQVLQDAIGENPKDEGLLSVVVQISAMFGRYTNALMALDRELEINPTNSSALVLQGYLQMQLGQYREAVEPLTRALTVETNNHTARFNRAVAYLRADDLEKSQADYEFLEKVFPGSFRIYYGLGEIAWRQKSTNAAIRYYQLYMTNAVAHSEEAKLVSQRLSSLIGTAAP